MRHPCPVLARESGESGVPGFGGPHFLVYYRNVIEALALVVDELLEGELLYGVQAIFLVFVNLVDVGQLDSLEKGTQIIGVVLVCNELNFIIIVDQVVAPSLSF